MHHTNLWSTKLFLSDWRFALYLPFPYLRFQRPPPTEPLGRRGQYWPTLDRLPPSGVCSGSRGPLSFRWISINKWHDILKTVEDKTNRRPDVAFRHFSSQYEVLANHFPPEIINYCSWLEELRHRLLPQTLPSTLLTDVVHTWTSSRLHVWHTNRLHQQHRRTYLPTFNSSLSMVVVISSHLPTEHSLFHAHVPLSATEPLLFTDCYYKTYRQLYRSTASLNNVRKHTHSGPRNRTALWLLIIVRYTNTLTYSLTYLLTWNGTQVHRKRPAERWLEGKLRCEPTTDRTTGIAGNQVHLQGVSSSWLANHEQVC